ncbi:SurA N-terminal domain-containing protein [Candidatus Hoaglandella endobia]|uniref:Peptidyl-prolyl cis-trans isomerase D n=1 Tax=Candidatus Hoaglandella endobia TaxID=1778263 RepID=A0A143WUF2_9ENTR|nr:SurA N-terminal domain-containing protein [Candidatus Hoaglandella endobia]CUX97222.1 Peptidyl-prolyl cis-trans isomerase D [Candidatus Hoaglandella endobia]
MMDNLCAAANHVVIKIILGLIAISLVLTEARYYFIGSNEDYAAKINGQQISHAQLDQAVQNVLNLQQNSMGEQVKLAAEGYMHQMRQQVLSNLINETLLDQYAEKLGLTISDEQIKQAIFALPAFITNNKFDNKKFQAQLNKLGLTPAQYATLIGKQLLTQQLIQGIGRTGFLLPDEINRLLAIVVQTRDVRLATFNIALLAAKQSTSQAEIQTSYNLHKNQYLSPEVFRVSYILMDAKDKLSDINTVSKKMLASEKIAAAGGIKLNQTGWFSRDNVPVELNYDTVKKVLFDGSLWKKNWIGSNSTIITVEGNRAFIICIAEHKQESFQPLDAVRAQLEQELKRQKAFEQAQVDASKMLVALNKGKVDAAALNVREAGMSFSLPQHFDSFDQESSLAQAVFMLPKPVQGQSSYGLANDKQGNLVLIALDSVKPRQLNDQQHKLFVEQLNQGMISLTFEALLKNLRSTGKIKIGTIAS